MIPVSDFVRDGKIVRARLVLSGGFIILLTCILFGKLLHLQVLQHREFSTLAQENRISYLPLAPVRGLIYDRNGEVLADNLPSYHLEILPDQVANMDWLLGELGGLIKLSDEDVRRFKTLLKRNPSFQRQPLRANLDADEASRIAVNQHRYRGVELRARLQRNYPHGELAAHIVGYVGRINADDIKKIDRKAYHGIGHIGRSGIEAQYESLLRGEPGIKRVETNAHGKIVRMLEYQSAQTGRGVHLSIDLELQRAAIEALRGYEGAIVAIEPDSGQVLAFAGAPGFDPNLFVNGISEQAFAALLEADNKPLLNRALYGRYAPGSTIKAFVLLAGMQNGVDPHQTGVCNGWFELPDHDHRYHDWKEHGHGRVDGHSSIVQSCDVYFYRLADALGIETLHAGMLRFGFGKHTGIDLPGEPSGLMPSPAWKQRVRGTVWLPGETVLAGIGQGYMLVTPLQLAATTALLANRGRRIEPRFLFAVDDPQTLQKRAIAAQAGRKVSLDDDAYYDFVIDAMHDVVHGERGTARGISYGIRYQMAGKTGTAQVKSIEPEERYNTEIEVEKKFRDHSLFIGFAPLDQPKIAVAIIVEHGGSGSGTAAPIARKLIDFYLIQRLGMFAAVADAG